MFSRWYCCTRFKNKNEVIEVIDIELLVTACIVFNES